MLTNLSFTVAYLHLTSPHIPQLAVVKIQRIPRVQNNSNMQLARGSVVVFGQQSPLEGSLFVRAGPQARHVCPFPAHVALGRLKPGRLRWGHVLFRCR